jgi:CBS domain./ACT domain.
MLIEDMMVKDVITIRKLDPIKHAAWILQNKNIRHLPVVDGNRRLIGLVTDRDIRTVAPSIFHPFENRDIFEQPVERIMKTDLITVHPLDFVEEAAILFYQFRIGCLPVVSEGRLEGIITQTDVLKTFVLLAGSQKPGTQIEINVENRPGILADILNIIRKHRINVHSVLVYPRKETETEKIIVLRIETINPLPVIEDLNSHHFHVLWPGYSAGYGHGH